MPLHCIFTNLLEFIIAKVTNLNDLYQFSKLFYVKLK